MSIDSDSPYDVFSSPAKKLYPFRQREVKDLAPADPASAQAAVFHLMLLSAIDDAVTLLVTSIMPEKLADLSNAAERAWSGRTDAVEVRIDRWTEDLARLADFLRKHDDRTWIVTCRGANEGGLSSESASVRAERLIEATSETVAYVDFEFADWAGLHEAQKNKLCASTAPDGADDRLILSAHDFTEKSPGVQVPIPKAKSTSGMACSKTAFTAAHITDSFAALDAMHDSDRPVAVMAMGEPGLWTRVLSRKLGAFATYCALEEDAKTAPGQLTLDDMVNRYRWHQLTESTQVYGVIGDPVGHSMSPLLFNRWFDEAAIDAVYLPLRVGQQGDGLLRFLDGCRERPWLAICGLSVTIPHKTPALEWVGDGADAMSAGIGALNTITFHAEKAAGYNTDCYAAVASMVDALGCERSDLAGVSVDLLGAGGAARGIMYGLLELGCDMTVFGRSQEKTRALANAFNAKPASWNSRQKRRGDILINCTNVGMWPKIDESPMPIESLDGIRLIFDLIYHPVETKLLGDARSRGIPVLTGVDMFVRQASMQFAVWTGRLPDAELGRRLVTQEIERRTGSSQ